MIRTLLLALMLLVSGPARAAWHEASSDHFLIYADASPEWLRAFATKLETYDAGLRFMRPPPVPESAEEKRANRLTIYVLPGTGAVAKLCGKGCAGVYGFYSGRANGSVAFTPRRSGSGELDLNADIVLQHEYTIITCTGIFRPPTPRGSGKVSPSSTQRRRSRGTARSASAYRRSTAWLGSPQAACRSSDCSIQVRAG